MWIYLDPFLVPLYSLTDSFIINSWLGTFLLAMLVVVVGEFTISIVYRVNARHLGELNQRVKHFSELSEKAFKLGDKENYKAVNKQANDAYGHVFFNKFGLSAAMLWPAFFALDWMQQYFSETDLPIPFTSTAMNYVLALLLCYIAARIVFGRFKRRLPYFKQHYRMLDAYSKDSVEAESAPKA